MLYYLAHGDTFDNGAYRDDALAVFAFDCPEYQVDFDREKLARYGLNLSTAATSLRNRINGQLASQFREDGEEYDIKVMYAPEPLETSTRVPIGVSRVMRRRPSSAVGKNSVPTNFISPSDPMKMPIQITKVTVLCPTTK